jgi:hypothetical protein
MCRSKTLLAVFLISGLTHVVYDYSMLGDWKLVTLVEEEAWEHRLFEPAEYEEKCTGFDDGCNPAGPTPTASVCDGSAGDESKTRSRSVCESIIRARLCRYSHRPKLLSEEVERQTSAPLVDKKHVEDR